MAEPYNNLPTFRPGDPLSAAQMNLVVEGVRRALGLQNAIVGKGGAYTRKHPFPDDAIQFNNTSGHTIPPYGLLHLWAATGTGWSSPTWYYENNRLADNRIYIPQAYEPRLQNFGQNLWVNGEREVLNGEDGWCYDLAKPRIVLCNYTSKAPLSGELWGPCAELYTGNEFGANFGLPGLRCLGRHTTSPRTMIAVAERNGPWWCKIKTNVWKNADNDESFTVTIVPTADNSTTYQYDITTAGWAELFARVPPHTEMAENTFWHYYCGPGSTTDSRLMAYIHNAQQVGWVLRGATLSADLNSASTATITLDDGTTATASGQYIPSGYKIVSGKSLLVARLANDGYGLSIYYPVTWAGDEAEELYAVGANNISRTLTHKKQKFITPYAPKDADASWTNYYTGTACP